MADQLDQASDLEELQRQQSIAAHLATTDQRMKSTGQCHNCQEELQGDTLFCDSDCRDDYDKRTRARRY